MNFITIENHQVTIEPHVRGVAIWIAPKQGHRNSGAAISLSMNFSQILRALREMDTPDGFSVGGKAGMFHQDRRVFFRLPYLDNPKETFTTALSETDSARFHSFLEQCISGGAHEELIRSAYATPQPKSIVGRNDPCPCGSGQKFKKCCAVKAVPAAALPAELNPFAGVEDRSVRAMLDHAAAKPDCLHDPEFWGYLGRELGTSGNLELAIQAHKRCCELAPDNPVNVADYALSLSMTGQHEAAWKLLEPLPNPKGQLSGVFSSVLFELGKTKEAIHEAERAINFEPDHWYHYFNLLKFLVKTDHPLYEFWLRRSHRQFPRSPAIAFLYVRWLCWENRLEELAVANWVKELNYIPDSRVTGRNYDGPTFIAEIQALQCIARCIAEENPTQLDEAAKILAAAPKDWHVCEMARQLVLAARHFGRRDLVWSASRCFCSQCGPEPALLQTFLAEAAIAAGDAPTAVKDAEIGLKRAENHQGLLNVYWWALDEVGRSNEALPIAQKLYEADFRQPCFPYNIAYIAAKSGHPATAIHFYEQSIQQEPETTWAHENLAILRLMEADISAANLLVAAWRERASESESPEQVRLKLMKYDRLVGYVTANRSSVSLAFDVMRLNAQDEPFFGASVKIPQARPTREQLVAAILGRADPNQQRELLYSFRMEERGDHSAILSRLESEIPGVHSLPRSALVSLIEAQAQWDENARADFAPCCMAFCKAVEISLFDLFQKFRGDIAAQPNFPAMLAQGGDPEFQKAQAFVRFLVKGSPLELGTTAFVLKLCLGNTGKNLAMLGALKQWLEASNCHALLKTETTDVISRLAAKYRNPAAHSDPFDRNTVNEARKLCFSLLKDLPISEGSPST